MNLEDALCSRTRIKILKMLMRLSQLNVTDIANRLGFNYVTTYAHLQILEEEDMIMHRDYGRTHLYRFSETSLRGKAVQALLEAWETNETETLT